MRIVSGFLKGKKINFLKSETTRPLRDFIKENIFNIINHSNLINIKLENASVLDLYSGVGSFGIECISRGARKVTFVENDNKALDLLKKI
jgi:16S rRNA (guanine966-N2)-methyltransferase|tara:strand:+ start:528 stop:797 length:270 start_codon:yes stop_codon:yes gene_type:complete